MRILLVNNFYKLGSTGKIVDSIGRCLRDMGHETLICYGYGDEYYDKNSVKICTKIEHLFNAFLNRITGIQYGGYYFSNQRLLNLINDFHPDIIHLHCINGYMVNVYSLISSIARLEIKTVITLHAEFFYTAGCSHAYECNKWKTNCFDCRFFRTATSSFFFDKSETCWRKMYNSIRKFAGQNLMVTAVSPWLATRAKQSSILKDYNIEYVPNGIDVNIFRRIKSKKSIIESNYLHKVIFVTPYFSDDSLDQKGGKFLSSIAIAHSDTLFIVVSSKIAKTISNLPKNIKIWGRAENQKELAVLYNEADVTLILSKRETFSMVTAESLCCGTPVVGFKAGGPESISLKEFTKFVDYGNLDAINIALNEFLNRDFDKDLISKSAMNKYSDIYMAKSFVRCYEVIYNNNSDEINMR